MRENAFEHKKETLAKFNPRLSANQPSNNWAQVLRPPVVRTPGYKMPSCNNPWL